VIIDIILSVGLLVTAGVAQMYRDQRDNLAAAWMHFHPEDFPDLTESDE
jgi:hypothetical protein